MAAEFWKERQIHGMYSALLGGLAGAAMTLAIFATIFFFAGNGPDPKNAGLLALPLYALVCVGLTISMYGVRYKNGTPIVSLHDRTTPLSTAKLTLIRTSVLANQCAPRGSDHVWHTSDAWGPSYSATSKIYNLSF